ncbi:MAG: hypothetical protein ACYC7F_04430, partial [Gemmatimonadaceae bacterium]
MIGGISATVPTGAFYFVNSSGSWESSSDVSVSWVNAANVTLSTKITDDDGATVNSGGDSINWSAWLPVISTSTRTLSEPNPISWTP